MNDLSIETQSISNKTETAMHEADEKNYKLSEILTKRFRKDKISFFSNDNISEHLSREDLEQLRKEVEEGFVGIMKSLLIDVENDHNSRETAARVAKMFIEETFSGRYQPMPTITAFPNVKLLDELYTVGPIAVNSACAHHLVPITGKVWIGVHPGENVIGLSKFHRMAHWIMRRPQIQEEATIDLADLIEAVAKPKGLGVVFKAAHMCCSWRGVGDENSLMTTSVVRGTIRTSGGLKEEFFKLVGGL